MSTDQEPSEPSRSAAKDHFATHELAQFSFEVAICTESCAVCFESASPVQIFGGDLVIDRARIEIVRRDPHFEILHFVDGAHLERWKVHREKAITKLRADASALGFEIFASGRVAHAAKKLKTRNLDENRPKSQEF